MGVRTALPGDRGLEDAIATLLSAPPIQLSGTGGNQICALMNLANTFDLFFSHLTSYWGFPETPFHPLTCLLKSLQVVILYKWLAVICAVDFSKMSQTPTNPKQLAG